MSEPQTVETPSTPDLATVAKDGDMKAWREARGRGSSEPVGHTADAVAPGAGAAASEHPPSSGAAPAEARADGEPDPDPASEAGKVLAEKRSRLEKRKTSIQGDIDALVKARGDHQREIAELEARKVALQREIDGKKPTPSPAPAGEKFPSYEAWLDSHPEGDYDTYRDEREDWRVELKLRERDSASKAAQQERATYDAMQDLTVRGTQAHADFEAVLSEAVSAVQAGDRRPFSPLVNHALLTRENGAEIAYALLKDAETADRLSAITDPIEFGVQLAAVLSRSGDAKGSGPSPAAVPVTKAPAPPKPVGSSAVASTPSASEVAAAPTFSLKQYRQARHPHART